MDAVLNNMRIGIRLRSLEAARPYHGESHSVHSVKALRRATRGRWLCGQCKPKADRSRPKNEFNR